jgi:hypothetical protein
LARVAHITTPTNHHLTVTLPSGKPAHAPQVAPVVYLQPKAERWREQTAEVHILFAQNGLNPDYKPNYRDG